MNINKRSLDLENNKVYDNSASIENAETTFTQFRSRFTRKNRGNRIKLLSEDEVKKDDEVYNQIFGNAEEEDDDFKVSENEEEDKDSFDSDFFNEEEESDEEEDLHDSEKEEMKQKAIKNRLKEKIEMLRRGKKNKSVAKKQLKKEERPRLVLKYDKNKITNKTNNDDILNIKINLEDLSGKCDELSKNNEGESEEISRIILEDYSEKSTQKNNKQVEINKVSLRQRVKVINYNDNDAKYNVKSTLESSKIKIPNNSKSKQSINVTQNFAIEIPKILLSNYTDKVSKSKKYKYDNKSALFFSGENHLVFYKKILVDYFTDPKFISKYNSLVNEIKKKTNRNLNHSNKKSKFNAKTKNTKISLNEEYSSSSLSSESELDSSVEKFKKSLEKTQNKNKIKVNSKIEQSNYWNVDKLLKDDSINESEEENNSNNEKENMLNKKRKKVALERFTEYMTSKTQVNKKIKKPTINPERKNIIHKKHKKELNELNDDDSEIFKMNETQRKKLGEEVLDEPIKINEDKDNEESGNIGFQYQKYSSYHQQPSFTQKELLYESIFTEIFNNQSLEELRKLEENTKKELPSSIKKKFIDFCKFKNNKLSKSGKNFFNIN